MMTAVAYSLEFEAEMAMAHVPVLTNELLDVLDLEPGSRVVDCTFGAGGHAFEVMRRLDSSGLLLACDRDPVAQGYFDEWKRTVQTPTRFYRGDFADTLQQLERSGQSVDRIYMDLGVSSMQIDTEERGFSYSYDAPLDMRMDPDLSLTAADILNEWDQERICWVLREFGEERFASRIARSIVRRRLQAPYRRTSELVDTVKASIPAPARFGSRNPARRVFQALRIAVNGELDSLRRALPQALSLLEPGGVAAVISFHSLEDRIVKEFFAAQVHPCTCPPDFPICVCGKEPTMEMITGKPITPTIREIESNPRSSSAKLRAARKL
ncbi:MAG TPA: 16S rRNA (cytosine(1402)-N(4))-methyltransferase RsmH [Thermoleophilia bacterium]|nr:16S rRNA (cytosine(1402)-N(4))-methyltransferase RsmH [Thermoleophilia bacterium]